jgi:hypothetical protein
MQKKTEFIIIKHLESILYNMMISNAFVRYCDKTKSMR